MRLSTTGSNHDEAGCVMAYSWPILTGLMIWAFGKYGIFAWILIGIISTAMLGGMVLLISNIKD